MHEKKRKRYKRLKKMHVHVHNKIVGIDKWEIANILLSIFYVLCACCCLRAIPLLKHIHHQLTGGNTARDMLEFILINIPSAVYFYFLMFGALLILLTRKLKKNRMIFFTFFSICIFVLFILFVTFVAIFRRMPFR